MRAWLHIFYLFYFLYFISPNFDVLKLYWHGTDCLFIKSAEGIMDAVAISKSLENITFSIQNCNSLNMSHSTSQNQRLKIEAITSLKTDIIMLCDLRLGNKNLTSCKGSVSNLFLINNNCANDFMSNSTLTKRGVGILFKKDLNIIIEETINSDDENFMLSRIVLRGQKFIIGVIYGPNEHNPAFFRNLYEACRRLGNAPLILGGDLNCTFSNLNVQANPDCFNMAELPNYRHSCYISEFCLALELDDPFRFLHPNSKKYTYRPFGLVRKNRSRIDFFMISKSLLNLNLDCVIPEGPLGTFFDHKYVDLTFNKNPFWLKTAKKTSS
jgi:exonuclease III